jgi:hypothetical protein
MTVQWFAFGQESHLARITGLQPGLKSRQPRRFDGRAYANAVEPLSTGFGF